MVLRYQICKTVRRREKTKKEKKRKFISELNRIHKVLIVTQKVRKKENVCYNNVGTWIQKDTGKLYEIIQPIYPITFTRQNSQNYIQRTRG